MAGCVAVNFDAVLLSERDSFFDGVATAGADLLFNRVKRELSSCGKAASPPKSQKSTEVTVLTSLYELNSSQYGWRSSLFSIFPEPVLGSSSVQETLRGIL